MTKSAARGATGADHSAVSYAELVGRARDLISDLRGRAEETERTRRITAATERDLHDTGLFRMLQPARFGGAEAEFGILIDAGAEIAKGCASTSWVLTNLASHHWLLAMFPEQAQRDVWDDSPDHGIASSVVFPAGRARKVKGGYVLSGRWPFSSGVDCSLWNQLGGLVRDPDTPDAPPEYRIFLLPDADYEVIDTWTAVGLSGTGSHDIAAQEGVCARAPHRRRRRYQGRPDAGQRAQPWAALPGAVDGDVPLYPRGCVARQRGGGLRRVCRHHARKGVVLQREQDRSAPVDTDSRRRHRRPHRRGTPHHAERLRRGDAPCPRRRGSRHGAQGSLSPRYRLCRRPVHPGRRFAFRGFRRWRALFSQSDPAPVPRRPRDRGAYRLQLRRGVSAASVRPNSALASPTRRSRFTQPYRGSGSRFSG